MLYHHLEMVLLSESGFTGLEDWQDFVLNVIDESVWLASVIEIRLDSFLGWSSVSTHG